MRFLHTSDLHIGKKPHGFDLEEDLRHAFAEIAQLAVREQADAVVISGDIYDRADPSASAVRQFDEFLNRILDTGCEAFLIYGNHDSPQRISFGSKAFERSGIHVAKVYDGSIEPVTLEDDFGKARFWMLPYLRAAEAEDALRDLRDRIDGSERNVLLSHQFVTGARIGDSEEMNVGALDNISAELMNGFDYAALGHIHVPQDVKGKGAGTAKIRYSGSPVAYSFSEAESGDKTVTLVDLKEKGVVETKEIALAPLHRMTTVRRRFDEILEDTAFAEEHADDYVRAILLDEHEIADAMSRLRSLFPNIMHMEYDFMRSRTYDGEIESRIEGKSQEELFAELYETQHGGTKMSEVQEQILRDLIREIWEGGHETD